MTNEKLFADQFELGVMTALQYIGMVLARLPGADADLMKEELESLKARLSDTPVLPGINTSPARAPLEALLKGLG